MNNEAKWALNEIKRIQRVCRLINWSKPAPTCFYRVEVAYAEKQGYTYYKVGDVIPMGSLEITGAWWTLDAINDAAHSSYTEFPEEFSAEA
jgi:hypothetical protein